MELLIGFLAMNLIGVAVMGIDKQRAVHHQYRIRERTLWLIAILGGAVGTTIGMKFFRHKTKHLSFQIGFHLLAIVEIILLIYLL